MCEEIVKRKGNKVTVAAAQNSGYSNIGDNKLCIIKDNQNGYTVKFPSYCSLTPIKYLNIDYDEAEYLVAGLQKFLEDQ